MTPQALPPPRAGSTTLVVVTGVALGYALSRIGFTDLDAVTSMFTFSDPRLILVFGLGVALTALGLVVTGRWRAPKRPLTKGAVLGGVLFGAGWAIAGACPGVAFAQLGEGKLWALVTIAGMALGVLACRALRGRLGVADAPACGE